MSKSRLKVWPVRAYLVDDARGIMHASLSGNSKQRRRARRMLKREGFNVKIHGPGCVRIASQ